jgi:hypothetical protein
MSQPCGPLQPITEIALLFLRFQIVAFPPVFLYVVLCFNTASCLDKYDGESVERVFIVGYYLNIHVQQFTRTL